MKQKKRVSPLHVILYCQIVFVFDEVEQVVEYPATFQPRIFNGVSVSIGGIHANSKYIRKQSVNI